MIVLWSLWYSVIFFVERTSLFTILCFDMIWWLYKLYIITCIITCIIWYIHSQLAPVLLTCVISHHNDHMTEFSFRIDTFYSVCLIMVQSNKDHLKYSHDKKLIIKNNTKTEYNKIIIHDEQLFVFTFTFSIRNCVFCLSYFYDYHLMIQSIVNISYLITLH